MGNHLRKTLTRWLPTMAQWAGLAGVAVSVAKLTGNLWWGVLPAAAVVAVWGVLLTLGDG